MKNEKIISIISLIAFLVLISGCGITKVAKDEFSASALLNKYEWFKDASAELDKKQADIQVYQVRLNNLESMYEGESRKDWARADINNYNLWQSEVAGVIASFNGLAAEYNAQMSKFNWQFTNAGTLPAGASEPLPREYKPYKIN